jgi:hypothetical protein
MALKKKKETPLNPPNAPIDEKQRELEGRRAPEQKSGTMDPADIDKLEGATPTDQYEGEEARITTASVDTDLENLDLLAERENRDGETEDAFKAAEEGMTYIPPVDPPTVPSDDYEAARVASGLSATVFGEPYDADHHRQTVPGSDELAERIYEALLADSSTTQYADQVTVEVKGDTAVLRGRVPDLVDSNNLAAVASYVSGIAEVVDEIEVVALEQ